MALGGSGRRLHLRCFLEGIEVPIVACQVQINLDAPAVAAIQLVPHDKLLELKPKTMVHIFFWDYTKDIPTAEDVQPLDPTNPTTAGSNYRQLFAGETVALQVLKQPAGRSVVLQCADFSTVWDTTYQIFISYSAHGNFLTEQSAVWAGGNTLFNDILDGHSSVLNRFLRSKPKSDGLQNVKGLMGGIVSLLEAMSGVPNHSRGVNDFATISELKNRVMQQVVAETDDDTAQRLMDEKTFMEWLTRGVTSMGELVTTRDMLKLLFKYIYYEVVPNPAPKYVQGQAGSTETQNKNVKIETIDGGSKDILTKARDECFDLSRVIRDDFESKALDLIQRLQPLTVIGKLPTAVQKPIARAIAVLGSVKDATQNPNVAASTDNLVRSSAAKVNKDRLFRAYEYLVEALSLSAGRTVQRQVKVTKKPERDHLYSQIFRPDCFFAAPPRCNVMFPDQIQSFTYSRQYLKEITRVRLSTSWFGGGSGGLLGNYFMAPNTSDLREVAKKQGNAGIRALLPWEKFTGILPKFEHVSEINYVANRQERLLKKNVRGQAASYSQRAANYNFYKYRFAARTAEISLYFNPFLVAGFPGLVIDKPWIISDFAQARKALEEAGVASIDKPSADDILKNLQTLSKSLGAPTQYLGMIAGLAHNLDQSGGGTTATMTHARSHRITEDDFLKIWSEEITKKASSQVVRTRLNLNEILQEGNFRLLKFLIDSTPQDVESKQNLVELNDQLNSLEGFGNDAVDLGSRPRGVLSEVDAAAIPSVSPLFVLQPDLGQSVRVESGEGQGFRGLTAIEQLPDSTTRVLVPNPGGKLKKGGIGPQGGKIVAIQLTTDAVRKLTLADLASAAKSQDEKDRILAKSGQGNKSFFAWNEAIIHEEVPGSALKRLIPPEESLRPPWFGPSYSSFFIGQKIYQHFFGCDSVVDEQIFQAANSSGAFGVNKSQVQQVLSQVQAAEGDAVKIAKVLDDAKKNKTLADVPDVESAADALAFIYGVVRNHNLDVHRFIANYTYRPIATLEEIFGTPDLQYEKTGTKLTKVAGTPGFHSTAVLPPPLNTDLLGLVDDPDQQLPRLKEGGKKESISRTLDPRPERRQKVLEYVNEIGGARGSLGRGVLG